MQPNKQRNAQQAKNRTIGSGRNSAGFLFPPEPSTFASSGELRMRGGGQQHRDNTLGSCNQFIAAVAKIRTCIEASRSGVVLSEDIAPQAYELKSIPVAFFMRQKDGEALEAVLYGPHISESTRLLLAIALIPSVCAHGRALWRQRVAKIVVESPILDAEYVQSFLDDSSTSLRGVLNADDCQTFCMEAVKLCNDDQHVFKSVILPALLMAKLFMKDEDLSDPSGRFFSAIESAAKAMICPMSSEALVPDKWVSFLGQLLWPLNPTRAICVVEAVNNITTSNTPPHLKHIFTESIAFLDAECIPKAWAAYFLHLGDDHGMTSNKVTHLLDGYGDSYPGLVTAIVKVATRAASFKPSGELWPVVTHRLVALSPQVLAFAERQLLSGLRTSREAFRENIGAFFEKLLVPNGLCSSDSAVNRIRDVFERLEWAIVHQQQKTLSRDAATVMLGWTLHVSSSNSNNAPLVLVRSVWSGAMIQRLLSVILVQQARVSWVELNRVTESMERLESLPEIPQEELHFALQCPCSIPSLTIYDSFTVESGLSNKVYNFFSDKPALSKFFELLPRNESMWNANQATLLGVQVRSWLKQCFDPSYKAAIEVREAFAKHMITLHGAYIKEKSIALFLVFAFLIEGNSDLREKHRSALNQTLKFLLDADAIQNSFDLRAYLTEGTIIHRAQTWMSAILDAFSDRKSGGVNRTFCQDTRQQLSQYKDALDAAQEEFVRSHLITAEKRFKSLQEQLQFLVVAVTSIQKRFRLISSKEFFVEMHRTLQTLLNDETMTVTQLTGETCVALAKVQNVVGGDANYLFLERVMVSPCDEERRPLAHHSLLVDLYIRAEIESCIAMRGQLCESDIKQVVTATREKVTALITKGTGEYETSLGSMKAYLNAVNVKHELAVLGYLRGEKAVAADLHETIERSLQWMCLQSKAPELANFFVTFGIISEEQAERIRELEHESPTPETADLCDALLKLTDADYQVFGIIQKAPDILQLLRRRSVTSHQAEQLLLAKIQSVLEKFTVQGRSDTSYKLLEKLRVCLNTLMPFLVTPAPALLAADAIDGRLLFTEMIASRRPENVTVFTHDLEDLEARYAQIEDVLQHGAVTSSIEVTRSRILAMERKHCSFRLDVTRRESKIMITSADDNGKALMDLEGDALVDFAQQVTLVVSQMREQDDAKADDHTYALRFLAIHKHVEAFVMRVQRLTELGHPKFVAFSRLWSLQDSDELDTLSLTAELDGLDSLREAWLDESANVLQNFPLLRLVPRQMIASLLQKRPITASQHEFADIKQLVEPLAQARENAEQLYARQVELHNDDWTLSMLAKIIESCFVPHPSADKVVDSVTAPCMILPYTAVASGSMFSFPEMHRYVLGMYQQVGRLPSYVELRYATPDLTVNDIEDFCAIVKAFPGGRYALLGAHVLKPAAREALLRQVAALRQERHHRMFLVASEDSMEDLKSCGAVAVQTAGKPLPSITSLTDFFRTHRCGSQKPELRAVIGPRLSGKTFTVETMIASVPKKPMRLMIDDAPSLSRVKLWMSRLDASHPYAIRIGVSEGALCSNFSTSSVLGFSKESHVSRLNDSRSVLLLNALLAPLSVFGCLVDSTTAEVHTIPSNSLIALEVPVDTHMSLQEVLPLVAVLATECVVCSTDSIVDRCEITPTIQETAFFLACFGDTSPQPQFLNSFRQAFIRAERNNRLVSLSDCIPQDFSEESVRRQLKRHVPVEFQANFVLLKRWLAVAEQRTKFSRHQTFAYYLFQGICQRCELLVREVNSAATVGHSPNANAAQPCSCAKCAAERRCELHMRSVRDHQFTRYDATFHKLVQRIIKEVSWFSRTDQTVSHQHMVDELGYVLMPQEANIVPYFGVDNCALPEALREFELIFSGAKNSLDRAVAEAKEKAPHLASNITPFHVLIAEAFVGSPQRCLDVATILEGMEYNVTDDTFVRLLSVRERMCAKQALIIKSKTGVGKSYQLQAVQHIVSATALHEAKLKAEAWLRAKLIAVYLQLCSDLSLPPEVAPSSTDDLVALASRFEVLLQGEVAQRAQQQAEGPLTAYTKLQTVFAEFRDHFPYLSWNDAKLNSMMTRIHDGAQNIFRSYFELLLDVTMKSLFFKVLVHPGLEYDDLVRLMRDVEQTAHAVTALRPDIVVTVFFDELNTSDIPCVFKSLIADRIFDGKLIPDNIFFVAAVNPHAQDEAENMAAGQDSGNYAVMRLHPSLKPFVQRFSLFEKDQLTKYIGLAVKRYVRGDNNLSHEDSRVAFTNLVQQTHLFCQDNLKMVVSQRDLQRIFILMDLMKSFLRKAQAHIRDHFACLVLAALYFSYCVRLSDSNLRHDLNVFVANAWRSTLQPVVGGSNLSMLEAKSRIVAAIVNKSHFTIPVGIALTDALAENLLVVLFTVASEPGKRVASSVVGKPGCGKTLTLRVIAENAKGQLSSTPFFKQIREVRLLTLQGSSSTTAQQIAKMFERAEDLQRTYPHLSVVIAFDEAGLSKDDMRVLKAIHQPLDESFVCFTCLSNRPFDDANQNRMLTAMRMEEAENDVLVLAYGCLGGTPELLGHMELAVRGLVDAFQKISKHQKYGQRYHNRDFVHLCQYFNKFELVGGVYDLQPADLVIAIEYNYNGGTQEELCEVAEIFFDCLAERFSDKQKWRFDPLQLRSPTKVIVDSLLRPRHVQRHLRHRYMLLFDPADDYSNALALIKKEGLWRSGDDAELPHVIFLSNFPSDATHIEDARVVGEIRYYMEVGAHVVIINGERILGHLFDVLNLNFSSMTDENGEVKYFAKVAIGTETHECVVHDAFRITFVMREKDFLRIEQGASEVVARTAPFLSRHETYRLEPAPFRNADRAAAILPRVLAFVETVGKQFFAGFSDAVTVRSAVKVAVDDHAGRAFPPPVLSQAADACEDDLQQGICDANCLLLYTAAPEAVVLAQPSLANGDAYLTAYFLNQEHFSLERLLLRTVDSGCRRWCLFTPDTFHARRLLDHKQDVLGSLGDASLVIGVDKLGSQHDLLRAVDQAHSCSTCNVLVLFADRKARDVEFLNKVCVLIDERATRADFVVVLVLLMPVKDFPANFTRGYCLHYLDTLVSPIDVVESLARCCGLSTSSNAGSIPSSTQPEILAHTIEAVARRYVSDLEARERPWDIARFRFLLRDATGDEHRGFYRSQNSVQARVNLLMSAVEARADLVELIVTCFAQDPHVARKALKKAAADKQNGAQQPLVEMFQQALAVESQSRANSMFDVFSQSFGLESLVSADAVGCEETRKAQTLLIRFLASQQSHPSLNIIKTTLTCWPPECCLNPWLFRLVRLLVEQNLPRSLDIVGYSKLLAERVATSDPLVSGIASQIEKLPKVEDLVVLYCRDVIAWTALAGTEAPTKHDVEVAQALYDVLGSDTSFVQLSPMARIVFATALCFVPQRLEPVYSAKLLTSLYRDLKINRKVENVVASSAQTVLRELHRKLCDAATVSDPSEGSNAARNVLKIFAVVRTWLLDRERIAALPESRVLLVSLDIMLCLAPHVADDVAGLQTCAQLARQLKVDSKTSVMSLEFWLQLVSSGIDTAVFVTPQDGETASVGKKKSILLEAFLYWLQVVPNLYFVESATGAQTIARHPMAVLRPGHVSCSCVFYDSTCGTPAAAALLRRFVNVRRKPMETMLHFTQLSLAVVVDRLPPKSPPYEALMSMCLDDEMRRFLGSDRTVAVALHQCPSQLEHHSSEMSNFVSDLQQRFMISALGACAETPNFAADLTRRGSMTLADNSWQLGPLSFADVETCQTLAAHIMRAVPDAAQRSSTFDALSAKISYFEGLAGRPTVFNLDGFERPESCVPYLPREFYDQTLPDYQLCCNVRRALRSREFSRLLDGQSIAPLADIIVWMFYSVYYDFVVRREIAKLDGFLEAAAAVLPQECHKRLLRLLVTSDAYKAAWNSTIGANLIDEVFPIADFEFANVAIDFAIRMVASCGGAASPLHAILLEPSSHKGTFAFGDLLPSEKPMIHGWDCGAQFDDASGARLHGTRADNPFTLQEQYFVLYSIYAALQLSGVLFPEQVASWHETAVTTAAIRTVEGQHSTCKMLKYVAMARQQHIRFMSLHVQAISSADALAVVLVHFHRKASERGLTNDSSSGSSRLAVEKAFQVRIRETLAGHSAIFEALVDAKSKGTPYATCEKLVPLLDVYPAPRSALQTSSASATLTMNLRDESSEQLLALKILAPLIGFYNVLHVSCAMLFSDSDLDDVDSKATLSEMLKKINQNFRPEHKKTVESGIAAWEELRKACDGKLRMACDGVETLQPEISLETPVVNLVTRSVTQNGLLLDVINYCLKHLALLRSKFGQLVDSVETIHRTVPKATVFHASLCQHSDSPTYCEATLAMVPYEYGVLNSSFGARMAEVADAAIAMNTPDEGSRVLLAGYYQCMQCALLTEQHIKRVYRVIPSQHDLDADMSAAPAADGHPSDDALIALSDLQSPQFAPSAELAVFLSQVPIGALENAAALLGRVGSHLLAKPDQFKTHQDTPLRDLPYLQNIRSASASGYIILIELPATVRCSDIGLLRKCILDVYHKRCEEDGFFEQYQQKVNRAAVSVRLSEDRSRVVQNLLEEKRQTYTDQAAFVAAANEDITTLLFVAESAEATDLELAEYIKNVMGFPESLLCCLPQDIKIANAVEVAAMLNRVQGLANRQLREEAAKKGRYHELPDRPVEVPDENEHEEVHDEFDSREADLELSNIEVAPPQTDTAHADGVDVCPAPQSLQYKWVTEAQSTCTAATETLVSSAQQVPRLACVEMAAEEWTTLAPPVQLRSLASAIPSDPSRTVLVDLRANSDGVVIPNSPGGTRTLDAILTSGTVPNSRDAVLLSEHGVVITGVSPTSYPVAFVVSSNGTRTLVERVLVVPPAKQLAVRALASAPVAAVCEHLAGVRRRVDKALPASFRIQLCYSNGSLVTPETTWGELCTRATEPVTLDPCTASDRRVKVQLMIGSCALTGAHLFKLDIPISAVYAHAKQAAAVKKAGGLPVALLPDSMLSNEPVGSLLANTQAAEIPVEDANVTVDIAVALIPFPHTVRVKKYEADQSAVVQVLFEQRPDAFAFIPTQENKPTVASVLLKDFCVINTSRPTVAAAYFAESESYELARRVKLSVGGVLQEVLVPVTAQQTAQALRAQVDLANSDGAPWCLVHRETWRVVDDSTLFNYAESWAAVSTLLHPRCRVQVTNEGGVCVLKATFLASATTQQVLTACDPLVVASDDFPLLLWGRVAVASGAVEATAAVRLSYVLEHSQLADARFNDLHSAEWDDSDAPIDLGDDKLSGHVPTAPPPDEFDEFGSEVVASGVAAVGAEAADEFDEFGDASNAPVMPLQVDGAQPLLRFSIAPQSRSHIETLCVSDAVTDSLQESLYVADKKEGQHLRRCVPPHRIPLRIVGELCAADLWYIKALFCITRFVTPSHASMLYVEKDHTSLRVKLYEEDGITDQSSIVFVEFPQSRCVVAAAPREEDSLRDVLNATCRVIGQSLHYQCYCTSRGGDDDRSPVLEVLNDLSGSAATVHQQRNRFVVVAVDPMVIGELLPLPQEGLVNESRSSSSSTSSSSSSSISSESSDGHPPAPRMPKIPGPLRSAFNTA